MNKLVILSIALSRVSVITSFVVVAESLSLLIASWAILFTWSIKFFCSSALRFFASSIWLFLAFWTCLIASIAACLVSDKLGTLTFAISSIPLFSAAVTAVLVVALLIASLATLAISVAWLINLAFSESLKLDALLISSFLVFKASSIALFAAFLESSKLVKWILLISATPLSSAVSTAVLVVALLIASLAALAISVAWLIKSVFSESGKLDALLISFFLEFKASSIAWVAFFLASSILGIETFSMFLTPVSAACLASLFVWALLISSIASVATFFAWSISSCFSSWLKLEALLISSCFSFKALLIRSMLSFLISDKPGTVTSAIAFSPSTWAVSTSELVVALLILSLAVVAASVACLIKSAFSSEEILVALLISSSLFFKAWSIAAFATSLAGEVVGTLMLLMSLTPSSWARVTSSGVVASAIFCFALSASLLIRSV